MVFLWAYALIQLLGLVRSAYKFSQHTPDADDTGGMFATLVAAILFGGLLWTILSVEPK